MGKASSRKKARKTVKTIDNTEPTVTGVAKAWRLSMEAFLAARKIDPEKDGTVDGWVVNAPWAHMVWPNYMIYCVHLRPIPGARPPTIHKQGATHEIGVYALNPSHVPTLDGSPQHFLTPANYVGQFIADSDDHARAIIEHTIHQICAGRLNPDTDARQHWKQLFGDDCFKKPTTEVEKIVSEGGTVIMNTETGEPLIVVPGQEPPPKPTAH